MGNIAGLPYPEPTDPISGGAGAIKALAEAVNTRAGRSAEKVATIVLKNTWAGTVTVPWPAGTFVVNPVAVVSTIATYKWHATVVNSTPGGAVITIFREDNPGSDTVYFSVHAQTR